MVRLNRHSPDSCSLRCDLRVGRAARNEIRSQPTLWQPKWQAARPRGAGTRCFAFVKAHLCRRRVWHLTRSPVHAGAGGARSRAMSIRISLNIWRGTATSAIWKVSHLEGHIATVADDFGADLDQLLAQAGQRPWLDRLGHRQRPHEVAEVVGERMKLKADRVGGEGTA
jgi:hypothetical protein